MICQLLRIIKGIQYSVEIQKNHFIHFHRFNICLFFFKHVEQLLQIAFNLLIIPKTIVI